MSRWMLLLVTLTVGLWWSTSGERSIRLSWKPTSPCVLSRSARKDCSGASAFDRLVRLRGGDTEEPAVNERSGETTKKRTRKTEIDEIVDQDKAPRKEKKKPKVVRIADLIDEDRDNSLDQEEDDNDDNNAMGAFFSTKNPSTPAKMFASLTSMMLKTPPITRYFILSSAVITILSSAFNGNRWPRFLHFEWTPFLFQFQWWRIVTAFLFFGQLDIFYPLTMQFVWQHMGQLERLNSKNPEDFVVMTVFGALALILLYPLLGISMKMVGHNLATFYVYIWARTFEGSDVNFMDFFTLKAELMPWFFCLQTFLLEQEVPLADLIGIVVGHIYYYLRNKGVLTVPAAVQEWFRQSAVRKAYGPFQEALE